MSPKEMAKAYDPAATEQRLYQWWESQGYFRPRIDPNQQPWSITLPPPNVTGSLHLGHAIVVAVEDLMTRWHRMRGEPTLFLPGSDHAGIATQNVVERELAKQGISRHDLGREKFIEKCWEWKVVYHRRITDQQRRLGISCDWERERFTLDPGLSRAVRTAFVRLYKEGLIYRGTYLVNWCPRCTSAISDLEVEHEDAQTNLWHVRYPLLGGDWMGPKGEWGSGRWAEGATEFIQVATTRPETILGDTAVAVNPIDERYEALIGRQAVLPALRRIIPVIGDASVDTAFGTGAVKVTPAHDPTDNEIGLRHNLAAPTVMDEKSVMNEQAGPYQGQDRFECRRNLVADLEKEGLLVKIEPHTHAVGTCERCHTVVEPRISTQWFVKTKPLAEPALQAVRDGRIRIVPERFVKIYANWMENIRDWCISRQLWWGHRIPVWYCDDCGAQTTGMTDPTQCGKCGSRRIRQDPDVLDTWFSSGLWPFSTLGWPDDTADVRYWYPTTARETGYDILFFWVAREIMLGMAMTGEVPYRVVYLHGIIRNAQGKKISKSMVDADRYDPINAIGAYGADALRFALVTGSTPGQDTKLSLDRVAGSRNFANKMWNAARFVLSNLGDEPPAADPWALTLEPVDRWILSRHNRIIGEVNRLMEDYQFGEAARQIYEFLWGEYCDWYIEAAKSRLYAEPEGQPRITPMNAKGDNSETIREDSRNSRIPIPASKQVVRSVLAHVLERTLRLLHPFMPFVTEEIWQNLPHEGEALIIAPWPEPGPRDEKAEAEMGALMDAVRAIRNARAEYNVEPGKPIQAMIGAGAFLSTFEAQRGTLVSLAKLDPERLHIAPVLEERPDKALALVLAGVEVYLPLAGMVDIDKERARLAKELDAAARDIARAEKLLGNPGFVSKAPEEVVDAEREKLAALRDRMGRLEEQVRVLGA